MKVNMVSFRLVTTFPYRLLTTLKILYFVFLIIWSLYLPESKSTTGGLCGVLYMFCGVIQAENEEYDQAEFGVHHEAHTLKAFRKICKDSAFSLLIKFYLFSAQMDEGW